MMVCRPQTRPSCSDAAGQRRADPAGPPSPVSGCRFRMLNHIVSLAHSLITSCYELSYVPLVEAPGSNAAIGKTLAAVRLAVDVPFEVWQFERSRAPHDAAMLLVMLAATVDYLFLSSSGMHSPGMDLSVAAFAVVMLGWIPRH